MSAIFKLKLLHMPLKLTQEVIGLDFASGSPFNLTFAPAFFAFLPIFSKLWPPFPFIEWSQGVGGGWGSSEDLQDGCLGALGRYGPYWQGREAGGGWDGSKGDPEPGRVHFPRAASSRGAPARGQWPKTVRVN